MKDITNLCMILFHLSHVGAIFTDLVHSKIFYPRVLNIHALKLKEENNNKPELKEIQVQI